jgi:large subunit ribosomal protein L4
MHSSIPSTTIFGAEKERKDNSAALSADEDEEDERNAAEDEAEATAVVARATGIVDASQRWAPTLALPVESFLNAEQQAPLGTVSLNPNIFMVPIRRDILHRVVVWQLAKRRQGTHKSKTKAEVRGGGRKPRPQKGSGRSRQGSIRSPLWVGGGHAHAKRPRDYYFPLLKRVRKLGLRTALSLKFAQGKLKIVRSTHVDEAKTKNLARVVEGKAWNKTLVIDGKYVDESFRKASHNLPSVKVLPVGGCNVFDILNHDLLVLTLEAVQHLEELLLEKDALKFYDDPTPFQPKEEALA